MTMLQNQQVNIRIKLNYGICSFIIRSIFTVRMLLMRIWIHVQ